MTIPGVTNSFEGVVVRNSFRGVINQMPDNCVRRVVIVISQFLQKKLGLVWGRCCMDAFGILLFVILIPVIIPTLIIALFFRLLKIVFGLCGIQSCKPQARITWTKGVQSHSIWNS